MSEKDFRERMNKDLQEPTQEELDNLHARLGIPDLPEIMPEDVIVEPEDEEALFAKWKAEQAAKKQMKKEQQVAKSNYVQEIKEIKEPEKVVQPESKKMVEPEKQLSPEDEIKKKHREAKDKIANIEINVDEIEIVDEPRGLSRIDDYNISLNTTKAADPTYQVVCNQSCYVANMKAIKYGDAIAIANSSASAFQERTRIYKLLYDKCDAFSVGNISFEDFLRITSFYDAETLMFGIYQQSFPGTTDFQVQCGSCGVTHNMQFRNEEFIAVKDEEVYKNIQETIASCSNPEEALKNSIVNKSTRKILPDSKIAVDVSIPSLKDNLDLLGSVNPKLLEENKEIISLMMFIKNVFMLDYNKTITLGKPCYYKIEKDLNSISRMIKDLSINDARELGKAIQDRADKHGIIYQLKSTKCPNPECGKELGDIPVDIEKLLFFNMLQ